MAGFGQFCPVAMACEVFAERWTPIILRELISGSHRFNEIHRCIPLISRPLLARRLRDLEAAGVLRSAPRQKGKPREYHLTESGREFRAAIEALGIWGQRWTVRVQADKLDSGLLMWNVRRRIALDRLPERRVVAHFRFRGVPTGRSMLRECWLILERSECDVCLSDPGYEVDLYVDADLASMVRPGRAREEDQACRQPGAREAVPLVAAPQPLFPGTAPAGRASRPRRLAG